EYAANLSFNDANFMPYEKWVEGVADSVRADPAAAGLADCAAGGDMPACLQAGARAFAARALRGAAAPRPLARFADSFTASVGQVGLPGAAADLVTAVLMSPSYVFRDEVQTDAAGSLLPAQRLQNLTYTLADAPPEAVGLSSAPPAAAAALDGAAAVQR